MSPNCFAAVVHAYLASDKFQGYPKSTQKTWRYKLQYAAHPDRLGGLLLNDPDPKKEREIRSAMVQAFLDGLATPSSQHNALNALRRVEKWALVRDRLPHPITIGCEAEEADGGHIPWTAAQVALGERHATPVLSKAITLADGTGQRGSDLVKMCWTDIETFDGGMPGLEEFIGWPGMKVIQRKTGKIGWVPFTQRLIDVLATWERRPGPILLRPDGLPWPDREALSHAWKKERNTNPELAPLRGIPFKGKLKDLVLHGLRATRCIELIEQGASTRQVADILVMSEQNVKRYTRFAEQKRSAVAAIFHLERTRREPPLGALSKNRA